MLCAFIHYAIIEKDDTRLYGNAIKIVLLHLNEKEFFIRSNAFGSIEFWIRVVRYD